MKGKLDFFWSQLRSWKTSRQIIVIESDDWGSERIPSEKIRNKLLSCGVDLYSNPHSKFDTLERLEDLEILERILEDLYERFQKKVIVTANFITANPDFSKIQESNFENYFFEHFTETYKNRDGSDNVINKIKILLGKGFIQSQFHGREHINVSYWLEELRRQNKTFLSAFNLGCYAIDAPSSKKSKNLMAALEFENDEQFNFIKESIIEGHTIFKNIFGFPADTFIAPRYVWDENLNHVFIKENFKGLQSSLYQHSTNSDLGKKYLHYTGQKNKTKPLKYSVRNVFFEPAYGGSEWVNIALKKIDLAFCFKNPAIITMHRINFVGGLDPFQRDKNLIQFKNLIEKIIIKYPKVEFLSTDELIKLI